MMSSKGASRSACPFSFLIIVKGRSEEPGKPDANQEDGPLPNFLSISPNIDLGAKGDPRRELPVALPDRIVQRGRWLQDRDLRGAGDFQRGTRGHFPIDLIPPDICTYAQPKTFPYRVCISDRKSTRLNSSHLDRSRMPSSA